MKRRHASPALSSFSSAKTQASSAPSGKARAPEAGSTDLNHLLTILLHEHLAADCSATAWVSSTLKTLHQFDKDAREEATAALATHIYRMLQLGLWPSQRLLSYTWHGLSVEMLPVHVLIALLLEGIEAELSETRSLGSLDSSHAGHSWLRLEALATLASAAMPLALQRERTGNATNALLGRLLVAGCRGVLASPPLEPDASAPAAMGETRVAGGGPAAVCSRLLSMASANGAVFQTISLMPSQLPAIWTSLCDVVGEGVANGRGALLPQNLRSLCEKPCTPAGSGSLAQASTVRQLSRHLFSDTCAAPLPVATRHLSASCALAPTPNDTGSNPGASGSSQSTAWPMTYCSRSMRRLRALAESDAANSPAPAHRENSLREGLRGSIGVALAHRALTQGFVASMRSLQQRAGAALFAELIWLELLLIVSPTLESETVVPWSSCSESAAFLAQLAVTALDAGDGVAIKSPSAAASLLVTSVWPRHLPRLLCSEAAEVAAYTSLILLATSCSRSPDLGAELLQFVADQMSSSQPQVVMDFCLRFLFLCSSHCPGQLHKLPTRLRRQLAAVLVGAGQTALSLCLFNGPWGENETSPFKFHGGLLELPIDSVEEDEA